MAGKGALLLLLVVLVAVCTGNSMKKENDEDLENMVKVFQEKMKERKLHDKVQEEEKSFSDELHNSIYNDDDFDEDDMHMMLGHKILSADDDTDDGDDDDEYDDAQPAQILGLVPNTFQDENDDDDEVKDQDFTPAIEETLEEDMNDKRVLGTISSKLRRIFGSRIAIPKGVQTVFSILERNLHLLHCLPTSCRRNVCTSGHYCAIPQLNRGIVRNVRAKLTLYTGREWKIRIDLQADFKLPWYVKWLVKVKLHPIIIRIRHSNGQLRIHSNSRIATGKIFWIIKKYKVYFIFDLNANYGSCLRPGSNRRFTWDIRVRYEIKKRRWWRWRCWKCADLIKRRGSFSC